MNLGCACACAPLSIRGQAQHLEHVYRHNLDTGTYSRKCIDKQAGIEPY